LAGQFAALIAAAACDSGSQAPHSMFPASCRGTLLPNEKLYENAEVEPFLAIDPADPNHLIGVWQQDRYSGGGAVGLLTGVSFDAGRTWTTTGAPFSRCTGGTTANGGDYERASDPWVTIAPDGTAHQIALSFDIGTNARNRAILASRSTDGGRSWTSAQVLQRDTSVAFALDKGSITADPNDAKLVYAVWDRLTEQDIDNSPNVRGPTWFARSIDGGGTWEPAKNIFDPGERAQTLGNVVAVVPDGTLLNVMLVVQDTPEGTIAYIGVLRSSDKGQTWSAPVSVSDVRNVAFVDPKTRRRVRTGGALPSIAVDASTHAVYVVWEDSRFSGDDARNAIALSSSSDGGLSWSRPVQVNRAPQTSAFTPSVAAGAGKLAVAYYDVRADDPADASRFLVSAWMAIASDAGATWQETALAGPFDLHTAPFAQGYFLGDYQGLAWDGAGFVSFFAAPNSGDASDPTSILFRRVAAPVQQAFLHKALLRPADRRAGGRAPWQRSTTVSAPVSTGALRR
jgi:hypothetical protein